MADWKPIGTCPHNQRVLIQNNASPDDEIAMAWLDRMDDVFYYAPQGGIVYWKPTHWMPIPDPPKNASQ